MPKVKLGGKLQAEVNKWNPLKSLIAGALEVKRMEYTELADMIMISRTTMYERRKYPQKYTIPELSAISRALDIPWEVMRNTLPA